MALIALGAGLLSLAVMPLAGPFLFERVNFINAPYWLAYGFEWHFIGVAVVLVCVSALATVIAPIVYMLWVSPDRVIREHAYASRGTGRSLWRRSLLIGQIALLTVLGVTAGLLVRSSYNVGQSQWGYPADKVFLAKMSNGSIDKDSDWYSPERLRIHRLAIDQIKARPETVNAALVDNPPGYSNGPYCEYAFESAGFVEGEGLGSIYYSQVTEGYFETLDVPFLQGEPFKGDIPLEGQIHAVINDTLARRLWPDGNVLERRLFLRFSWMKETDFPIEVVVRGVVRDFQACGPTAKSNDAIFFPFSLEWGAGAGVHFVVRDRAGIPSARSLTDAIHRADPRTSLYYPSTIKGQIDLVLSSMHMTADLTTVFALAALLLGAIGVYSLTISQVLQSSREFGIRMALGAEPRQLWMGFTKGHMITALIGVAVGLIGASQLVRVLESLLFGIDPYNVATYAGVAFAILAVSALACLPSLFGLRRINPADCLRSL